MRIATIQFLLSITKFMTKNRVRRKGRVVLFRSEWHPQANGGVAGSLDLRAYLRAHPIASVVAAPLREPAVHDPPTRWSEIPMSQQAKPAEGQKRLTFLPPRRQQGSILEHS